MANQLRVINASASQEPLYVFVTPNYAWQVADGLVGLVSLIIPVGEITEAITQAIAAARAAGAATSTGLLADLTAVLSDAVKWFSGTWVGTGATAVFEKGKLVFKSIYDVYMKFSQILAMKTALSGIGDVIGGNAGLEKAKKMVDQIIAAFEKVFAESAYKILPLEIQGYDQISRNPLAYLAPSGWAALANADTAHLTVYRKGRYLADFNAHSQSAYVCTEDQVWRIDGENWADRVETIHGITPVQIDDKPRQDVDCHFVHDLKKIGDPKEGYKTEEILSIPVKPEHRVLPMTLRFDLKWRDQGSGNQKGQILMALMRQGKLVSGENGGVLQVAFGPAPHQEEAIFHEWTETSEFVKAMLAGDEIVFSVVTGAGGGHELDVKSLMVTLPTSTLIYQGSPFEKAILPDAAIRNVYHTFPVVTNPHKALSGREKWVPRLKRAQVVVNWDAPTLYNEYELKKALRGEEVESGTQIMFRHNNNSIRTVMEVWKGGAKIAEGNLWTDAPDPYGLKGPDLWEGDVPDNLLTASQLPSDSAPTPIEWAISVWYEVDNHWTVFRRETHLQVHTFAIFVEYHW